MKDVLQQLREMTANVIVGMIRRVELGVLMTADSLPALANFRDLGGLPTDDARLTRRGVLYRSDAPFAGDQRPSELPWPPSAVIDLRSGTEAIAPHPLCAPNTTIVRVDLLGEAKQKTLGELRAGGDIDLQALYRDLITRAGEEVHAVLELLLETDGPVLVHCAAGKDRTGVLVAVLLRAAGVTREAVIDDYVLTGAAMTGVRRRMESTDAEIARLVAEFPEALTAPADAIGVVLDHIEAMPGGTFAWLIDRGVPPELISRWTDRLVAPARGSVAVGALT
jgi:protein-tyrosine phosphatase